MINKLAKCKFYSVVWLPPVMHLTFERNREMKCNEIYQHQEGSQPVALLHLDINYGKIKDTQTFPNLSKQQT